MQMAGSDAGHIEIDVAVVGAGPAGRWLATLLVRRGVDVAIFDPGPKARWPNTYGVWSDEIEELEIPVALRRSWPQADVVLDLSSPQQVVLEREYCRIDNDAFQGSLDDRLDDGGARWIEAKVIDVEHQDRWSSLTFVGGEGGDEETIRARIVVDASGGAAGLLEYVGEEAVAFQTAFGVEADFDGDPLEGRQMVLMDYRAPCGERDENSPPTFLYGMHLGGDRYFVEETVLVAPGAVDFDELRRTLEHRLDRLGVSILETHEEEFCKIPMGGALPSLEQRVLGFGAAAGLVHPATGYQMARMLRAGAPLADTIAEGLEGGLSPEQIARAGWQILWSDQLRRAHLLLLFGRDVLAGFDREEISQFFEVFFSLPGQSWRQYMSGETGHREMSGIMLRLFADAENSLRWALARRALGDGRRVGKALLPGAMATRRHS